jgi:serine/threonine protein kinase
MEIIINEKYKLNKIIGEGSFGKIFEAKHILSAELVAIKIEKKMDKSILKHEASMYNECKSIKGIPKLRGFGKENEYNYIVTDLLGDSIELIKQKCGGTLNLRSVLSIGIQLLTIFEQLHNKGIIHRDIKPENILLGLSQRRRKDVYLIDFGLAKYYIDNNRDHIQMNSNKKLTGTLKYVSLNVQNGIEPSRRDDLESIGYILIYCLKGCLPWEGSVGDIDTKYAYIKRVKEETELHQLCSTMPYEFLTYMDYCRKLEYNETPDYTYLKCIFMNLFKRMKYNFEDDYEWMRETI